ncbi:hypothetical protein E1H12_17215 [Geitlerinema sp. P-1104]|uniref:hypothetical protein n=1 Tax=Geitlerinema sp. P-1104 TaxID=2546230 RepID=UPI001477615B|nr:hypothetical protein [Geitlerinema sp. P-1104]NMG60210.1 hypothetical protein [Geitlerinema sp. P-1104]
MGLTPGQKLENQIEAPNQVMVSRSQLRGYGASRYLTRALTDGLEPMAKQGNAYLYGLPQLMEAIKTYLLKPKIHQTTRQILQQIWDELAPQMQNVIAVPFEAGGDPELRKLCLQAMQSKTEFDRKLSRARGLAATRRGGKKG